MVTYAKIYEQNTLDSNGRTDLRGGTGGGEYDQKHNIWNSQKLIKIKRTRNIQWNGYTLYSSGHTQIFIEMKMSPFQVWQNNV